MIRRFKTVNVFSDGPVDGNPLAVVVDSEGLDSEDMLAFTRWSNLSETAFLLPPSTRDADYRVRIFTLEREVPFAGHPTLGACHAWLEAGGQRKFDDRIVQECGAGLVSIRTHDSLLWFEAPALIRDEPVSHSDLGALRQILGLGEENVIDAHWLDNGPGWVVLLLDSVETLLSIHPQQSADGFDIGLVAQYRAGHDPAVEVRALFSDHTGALREDPVTGSLNASIGQWLFRTNRADSNYVAAQGRCLGRAGRVHLEVDSAAAVWVGGSTSTIVDGHARL